MNEITFKRLNGLTPTIESCTMKVLEEVGELMQMLGKGQGLSGEKTKTDGRWATNTMTEALDTAQAAVTLLHVLSKEYNISLNIMIAIHELKLFEKGYLKNEEE